MGGGNIRLLPKYVNYTTSDEVKNLIIYEDFVDGTKWTSDELANGALLALHGLDPEVGSKIKVTIEVSNLTPKARKELWDVHIGPVH